MRNGVNVDCGSALTPQCRPMKRELRLDLLIFYPLWQGLQLFGSKRRGGHIWLARELYNRRGRDYSSSVNPRPADRLALLPTFPSTHLPFFRLHFASTLWRVLTGSPCFRFCFPCGSYRSSIRVMRYSARG